MCLYSVSVCGLYGVCGWSVCCVGGVPFMEIQFCYLKSQVKKDVSVNEVEFVFDV